MVLVAKNKDGFVSGSIKNHGKSAPTYKKWTRCDLTVLRWMQNSFTKKIRDNFSYVLSSSEFWAEINERY